MNNHAVKVGAFDRLSFTVFLALALHALFIFGVGFSSDANYSTSPTLDVTLSLHKSDVVIDEEDADFLSDADQKGSGTIEEKERLKTTEQAEIEDNQIFHTVPVIQKISFAELSIQNVRIISTDSKNKNEVAPDSDNKGSSDKSMDSSEIVDIQNINDVATLKALLDEKRQERARRPRTQTLTANSAKRAVDAKYIFNWLEDMERIGNQNYPDAARKQRLAGLVRLAVAINPDGSLRSVTVTGSSGSTILDQAAKQIVYLSAPFDSFNAEMLDEYDVLEIIRTWKFSTDNNFGLADG